MTTKPKRAREHRLPEGVEIPPVLQVKGRPRAADVLASQWPDPTETNANRRNDDGDRGQSHTAARKINAYRNIPEVERLNTISPRVFTKQHVSAAARITDDYEAGEGVHGAGRKLTRVDGEDGDKGPLDHQLDAKARFTAAMRALGHAAGEVISAVVLSNWRLPKLAEEMVRKRDPKATVGDAAMARASERLAAALDRLVEHYVEVDADRKARRPTKPVSSGFGAPPAEGPDERVGRWRSNGRL